MFEVLFKAIKSSTATFSKVDLKIFCALCFYPVINNFQSYSSTQDMKPSVMNTGGDKIFDSH